MCETYSWTYVPRPAASDQPLGPVSPMIYELIIKTLQQFIYNFYYNDPFMSQFSTCHSSSAAVACAKLWYNLIIIFHIRTTHIFTRFGSWVHKPWVRCVPGIYGIRRSQDISTAWIVTLTRRWISLRKCEYIFIHHPFLAIRSGDYA